MKVTSQTQNASAEQGAPLCVETSLGASQLLLPVMEWATCWEKMRRACTIAAQFFLGQGALQLINVLTGIFLVHVLSLEKYAQFGLAFGFQTTVSGLMSLGYAGTIIPLVGERVADRALVGRYVQGAKHLRDRTFLVLSPFACIAFVAIMARRHWPWQLQVLLTLPVLLSVYSSGPMAYYSAPLILYGRLKEFYVPQTLAGIGRLATSALLYVMGALNAWTAAAANAVSITTTGFLLGKNSRNQVVWPEGNDGSAAREIFHYVVPAMPAIILGAFQPQIALFLISLFGQTANIAQVAALSRISQVFFVFTTFNTIVVEPYMARLPSHRLLPVYLRNILLAAVCCAPLVLLAFSVPQAFLWLLGSKYMSLGSEVGWVILAACIGYLAGLIWIMNRARKWLFWSGTVVELGLLVGVQVIFIALVGVRTTHNAVMFSLAASFCYLAAHSYVAVYGFFKGSRRVIAAEAPLATATAAKL